VGTVREDSRIGGSGQDRRGIPALGDSSNRSPAIHVLVVDQVLRDAACPVIGLLATDDPEDARAVAGRGVFDCVVEHEDFDLAQTLDRTLGRFAGYQAQHGPSGRRAAVEQAKGILMEAHATDAAAADEMLRAHAEHAGRDVADVAEALLMTIVCLPGTGRVA
jgi:AmiR/NasT family two-component response regulator